MKLGEKIQMLRTEKHMTATALGNILNKAESTIRMWESDKSKPDIETLVELSKIFNCSTDFLLSLSPHRNEMRKERLNKNVEELSNNLAQLDNQQPSGLIREIDSIVSKMLLWKVEPPKKQGVVGILCVMSKIADVIGLYTECICLLDDYADKASFLQSMRTISSKNSEDIFSETDDEINLSNKGLIEFKTKLLKYHVSKENCLHELRTLLYDIDLTIYEKTGAWLECAEYFNEYIVTEKAVGR